MTPPIASARAGVVSQVGGDIPDSGDLLAHYNFSEYTGSQNFNDLTGNGYDLVNGTITGTTDSINGNQAGKFDRFNNDTLDTGSFSSSISTPYTVFVVCRLDNPSNGNLYTLVETDDDRQQLAYQDNNLQWFWNSAPGGVTGGSANDTLISLKVSNTNDTVLRADGVPVGSDNNGENFMNIIRLGSENGNDEIWNGAIGEVLVYKNDKSGKFSDIENYLAGEWGISI